MKLWVVLKSPVDLHGAYEIIGVFSSKDGANAAIGGAGTYMVAQVEPNRVYSGDLFDVDMHMVMDNREF